MATTAKAKSKQSYQEESLTASVLESRTFKKIMDVGSSLAGRKKRLFLMLQQAFEKLKDPAVQQKVKGEIQNKIAAFIRLVNAYRKKEYTDIPWSAFVRVVGALVYFVWVLDVIPDFIPLFGMIDDIAVIIWVWNGISEELQRFQEWEKNQ